MPIILSGSDYMVGYGKLLSAPNGLESVGVLGHPDRTYVYGVKER